MERTIIDILRGASALFYDSYNSLGSISVYYQGMKYPVIYQLPFSYRDCIGIECPQVVLSYPRAVDSIDYDTLQCLLKKNYQAGNYVFTAQNSEHRYDTTHFGIFRSDVNLQEHYRLTIIDKLKGVFTEDTIGILTGNDFTKYISTIDGSPVYSDSTKTSGENVQLVMGYRPYSSYQDCCYPSYSSYEIPALSKWLVFGQYDTLRYNSNPGFSSMPILYKWDPPFQVMVFDSGSSGAGGTGCANSLYSLSSTIPIINDSLVFSAKMKMAFADFIKVVNSPNGLLPMKHALPGACITYTIKNRALYISSPPRGRPIEIAVFDITGRQIAAAILVGGKNKTIPLTTFSRGLYLLRARQNGRTTTSKFELL